MIDRQIFSESYVDDLRGDKLLEARAVLIATLSDFVGLEFSLVPDECLEDLWRTGIEGHHGDGLLRVSWHGIIGASDYRSDDTLVYYATMFPVIGGHRVLATADLEDRYDPTYAFQYASIAVDGEWESAGWHSDEFDEYVGWYAEPKQQQAEQVDADQPTAAEDLKSE